MLPFCRKRNLLVGSLILVCTERIAEKILNTADSLMVQRGYLAFSYADISEAFGSGKRASATTFPTKSGLAVAVLRAHRERVIQGAGMLDSQIESPLARLHAYRGSSRSPPTFSPDWATLKAGVKKQVIQLQSTAATEAQTLMAVVHGGMLSARALENGDVFKIVTDAALKRISAGKR
jgi:TetR/AcrR family transcriptional regulator, transcriptional repressor for nem operon